MNKETESVMRGWNILLLLSGVKARNFQMSQFKKENSSRVHKTQHSLALKPK